MSTFALTDAVIWAGGYDLSGDSNSVTINSEVEDLEVTTFGSSFRSRIGGLRSVSMDVSGFWQAGTGTVDPELFSALGVRNRVVTVAPEDAEGATADMFRAGLFSYEMFGAGGEGPGRWPRGCPRLWVGGTGSSRSRRRTRRVRRRTRSAPGSSPTKCSARAGRPRRSPSPLRARTVRALSGARSPRGRSPSPP